MKIRKIGKLADIDKITELQIKVHSEPPYTETWTKEQAFTRLLEIYKMGKGFCFYAEENSKVIGCIFAHQEHWQDGVHLIVESVVVNPEFRGKGVGTKLVEKLEKTARKKGIASLDLLTMNGCNAQNFWKNRGFTENGYVQMMKRLK